MVVKGSQIEDMDNPEYYKKYSNASIIDTAQSIDRMRFADRAKLIDAEISRRGL